MAILHLAVGVDFFIGKKSIFLFMTILILSFIKITNFISIYHFSISSFQSHPAKYNRPSVYVQHPPVYNGPTRVKFSVRSYKWAHISIINHYAIHRIVSYNPCHLSIYIKGHDS